MSRTKRIPFDIDLWKAGKGKPVYRVGHYPDCVLDTGLKDWPLVSVIGHASETHKANGRARNEYETTNDLFLEVPDEPKLHRIGFADWEKLPVVWVRAIGSTSSHLVTHKHPIVFKAGDLAQMFYDSEDARRFEWSTDCKTWRTFEVEEPE